MNIPKKKESFDGIRFYHLIAKLKRYGLKQANVLDAPIYLNHGATCKACHVV